ncbi:MAG TPA: cytochrome C oxidase subunit IV family protein [Sandaracinaceae bacterium LLY-WYZ-13_1]|nr:cytochrome C oxidase subunit IV family protein [Sandaracinaceae bacterium LLY-WYZ-13_1]
MKRRLHITPRTLWIAFAALLVLAAGSWASSLVPLGALAVPLGLGVAALKVAIVGLVFMDLGEHGGGVRLAAVVAPAFLALMIAFMLGDVWLR